MQWPITVTVWVLEEYQGWKLVSGILRVQKPRIPIIEIIKQ